ncbi:PAS domain-containing protein [Hymenobacter sp. BT770]|uniref:PAS domain-containing protein n=1 Tax=Hymenobacter sp. BT770 TaxID=2886942 RepID=UPI001D0F60D8|nr:PAS domain-containing protein [Hymenobacter sp. BT770]MCC3153068.1 PAS domain-containing protein [Hymenobacter sp. BT770]MDO3415019.1 PAS domain-containing protein [Hymenobacter sp. BT770]
MAISAAAENGLVGHEQFAFLADVIPPLVWITDANGFHIYFNQRWIDFTGYDLADSVGPDMWNNLLHPDDQARARQVWGHSLATGEDYNIEYRFKAKDGSYRWFLGQALPRRGTHGQIIAWFGTCTDIQEQRQMREQLEAAYSDLEAKITFRTLDLEREVQALKQQLSQR